MSPSTTRPLVMLAVLLSVSGCSFDRLVARGASPLISNGVAAMNRETDVELARDSIPANLKMLEALINADPDNADYQVKAAMGFNGYALGFVEGENRDRAVSLYRRALDHAAVALALAGLPRATLNGEQAAFDAALAKLDKSAVPALFWAASSWGKWIELQLDEPARIAELPRVEAMMRRVVELDEGYFHAGAHLFFGAYYGGRAPMFGGDFERAARHFDRAAELNHGDLLWVDVYRAKYLLRQMGDEAGFHAALEKVVAATPADPDLNLANALARRAARALLDQEEELF